MRNVPTSHHIASVYAIPSQHRDNGFSGCQTSAWFHSKPRRAPGCNLRHASRDIYPSLCRNSRSHPFRPRNSLGFRTAVGAQCTRHLCFTPPHASCTIPESSRQNRKQTLPHTPNGNSCALRARHHYDRKSKNAP